MAGHKKQKTPWAEAKKMHNKLRDPCSKLLKHGFFRIKIENQRGQVLDALCQSPVPIRNRGIAAERGIPSESISSKWRTLKPLFSFVKPEFRGVLEPLRGLRVSKTTLPSGASGPRTAWFLNLPEFTPEEAEQRAQRASWKALALTADRSEPTYVLPIDRVLKPEVEEPEWFRDEGPLLVDFDDGRVVYSEEELQYIHEQVCEHSVFLIEGDHGSGKSVLVRAFAVEYRQEMPIYYFSFKSPARPDLGDFIREVRGLRGLIILEDIHQVIDRVSLLLSRLSDSPARRVVLTALSGFRDRLSYGRPGDQQLLRLPYYCTRPADWAEEIMDNYFTRQDVQPTEWDRGQLKQHASENDLWTLAHALEGYKEMNGSGIVKEWIEHTTACDLEYLKRLDHVFPKIILALAPLSRWETAVAERFLLRDLAEFQITEEALENIVQSTGKVIRQKSCRHTYYSLRHSALANMYSKRTIRYRNNKGLPSDLDIVRRYIKSKAPNALRALTKVGPILLATNTVNKKALTNIIPDLLKNEEFVQSINKWLRQKWAPKYLTEDAVRILAIRIAKSPKTWLSFKMLLRLCEVTSDPEALFSDETLMSRLRQKMLQLGATGITRILNALFSKAPGLARNIWKKVDKEEARHIAFDKATPRDAAEFLGVFGKWQPSVANSVTSLITADQLIDKIKASSDGHSITRLVEAFRDIEPQKTKDALAHIPQYTLTEILAESDSPTDIVKCIAAVSKAHRATGEDLFWHLHEDTIVPSLAVPENVRSVGPCIIMLHSVSETWSQTLCEELQLESMACQLSAGNDPKALRLLLKGLIKAHPARAQTFAQYLETCDLANAAQQWSCIQLCRQLHWINQADSTKAIGLWERTGAELIADKFLDSKRDEIVESLLVLRKTLYSWVKRAWQEYVKKLQSAERQWTEGIDMKYRLSLESILHRLTSLLQTISNEHESLSEELRREIPDGTLRQLVQKARGSS